MLEAHADVLRNRGLVRKAHRELVERAGSRSIEETLVVGLPIVMSSATSDRVYLYMGFRSPEPTQRTKIVLVGTRHPEHSSYLPAPDSYFTEADCMLVDELVAELERVNDAGKPSYDIQFGIELSPPSD